MKRISPLRGQEIAEILFAEFGKSEAEDFLREELRRYIPELGRATPQEIGDFAAYQRALYLKGERPEMGRPIASLNPTFVDSLEDVVQDGVYVCASIKENGYRLQLHNGQRKARAFTRQFKEFDLHMFPELLPFFSQLPVMNGDAELMNAQHPHLAGFNRLQDRVPPGYLAVRENQRLDDDRLQEYFQRSVESRGKTIPLFIGGKPQPGYEVTLSFHGLFALADPVTWKKSRKEQERSLISFCQLPINYEGVNHFLDLLEEYIKERQLPFRVVQRKVVHSPQELEKYVQQQFRKNLEGVCVVRSRQGDFSVAKSVKIKRYETVDAVVLGFYMEKATDACTEKKVRGALLGLYDPEMQRYLPAFKVNLDPRGEQVKTKEKQEHLRKVRRELLEVTAEKVHRAERRQGLGVSTVYEAFLFYGAKLLEEVAPLLSEDIPPMLEHLPRGHDFLSLWELYASESKAYHAGKRMRNKRDQFITDHQRVFGALTFLSPSRRKKVVTYFSKAKEMRGKRLVKPHYGVDLQEPVLVEARVFNVRRSLGAFAAGFSPKDWQCFDLSNAYLERLRQDKGTTTDYATLEKIARRNMV